MKKSTNRKVIRSFADVPVKETYIEVEVPEWGEKNEQTGDVDPAVVLMRRISQGERRRFTAKGELGLLNSMNQTERDEELARWKEWFDSGQRERELLKMCFVSEDGSQLFSDEETHRLMENIDMKPVFRLISKAEEENLMTATSIEEFRKNG